VSEIRRDLIIPNADPGNGKAPAGLMIELANAAAEYTR